MSGFIDRRQFVAMAAGLGVMPVLGADGPPQSFSNYGVPSPFENRVIRLIGNNPDMPGNGVSWTPLELLEGIVTPTGLHFERHHNGIPKVAPERYELSFEGLIEAPQRFNLSGLMRAPMVSRLLFLECGGNSNAGWHENPMQKPVGSFHGLVSCSEWAGIPLKHLIDAVKPKASATWVIAEGYDEAATEVSLPITKLKDDALLALYQNGERLRPENGYPARLVLPGWEGVRQIKWLKRLTFTDQPVMSRNETAQYTELLPSGIAEQFHFVMGPKSLITSPSQGQHLATAGLIEVKGLAWSGHGRVRTVEVSDDGGKHWTEAHLDGPILPQCFTRFRTLWQWDGKPAVLQSRITDEKGNVQPTRAALVKARGRNSYFHYNAIFSLSVDVDNGVRHVYA